MAPINAGTLKVVCNRKQCPDNTSECAGQRRDNDEGIKPALEINDQQKINQRNGHQQSNAQAEIAVVHCFRLTAKNDGIAAR